MYTADRLIRFMWRSMRVCVALVLIALVILMAPLHLFMALILDGTPRDGYEIVKDRMLAAWYWYY